MENRPVFGRRAPALPQAAARKPFRPAPASPPPQARADAFGDAAEDAVAARVEDGPASPPVRHSDPVDAELEDWKRNRKKLPLFAWRPLYFMASLCFGLASFVLPDSVNNLVQWPLYALAAMSFYMGMKMRREKRAARRAEKLETAAQSGL